VWEENEFWLELTWRIDPDGSLGIRQYAESKKNPGTRLGIDEYYEWIFDNSVPGLPERAAAENLTPLEFMRRYGAFEVKEKIGRVYEELFRRKSSTTRARSFRQSVHARAETGWAKHRSAAAA
jgi:hypothetical protein